MPHLFTPETVKELLRKVANVKGADADAIEAALANAAKIGSLANNLDRLLIDIRWHHIAMMFSAPARALAENDPEAIAFLESFHADDPRLPYLRAFLDAAREIL